MMHFTNLPVLSAQCFALFAAPHIAGARQGRGSLGWQAAGFVSPGSGRCWITV